VEDDRPWRKMSRELMQHTDGWTRLSWAGTRIWQPRLDLWVITGDDLARRTSTGAGTLRAARHAGQRGPVQDGWSGGVMECRQVRVRGPVTPIL
jgi:hypothetical protein